MLRHKDDLFPHSKVILAEQAAAVFDARIYEDLLQFERDIASVSRLVMLVSESAGSIAELGAFSQISEIQEKLLVFMHTQFYGENSFIKNGPLRYLETKNEQSVQEFDWKSSRAGNLQKESATRLIEPMTLAIAGFLKKQPRTEKFDRERAGHQILLVAGIIYTLRCCRIREIALAAKTVGVEIPEGEIKKMIFCLKLFGWIRVVKRETAYYIYDAPTAPFIFRGHGSMADFDPIRIRHDILHDYPDDDPRLVILDAVLP
tara:strand:- start:998 stop:1777 length:780 start_codon:yes stop_codon:yes gene_type:complete